MNTMRALLISQGLLGCDLEKPYWQHIEEETETAWNGRCIDATKVVPRVSYSSGFRCWNKNHRMSVEPRTINGEEMGSVVHCRCERPDGGR